MCSVYEAGITAGLVLINHSEVAVLLAPHMDNIQKPAKSSDCLLSEVTHQMRVRKAKLGSIWIQPTFAAHKSGTWLM